jgi:hypothetical protein
MVAIPRVMLQQHYENFHIRGPVDQSSNFLKQPADRSDLD